MHIPDQPTAPPGPRTVGIPGTRRPSAAIPQSAHRRGWFSVLDKYIFKQLLAPFFFGFFLFVVVIAIDPLMAALQNIINEGIPVMVVIDWFFARLPQDMVFTFPMSVLLSTLIVFGRMSKDSETIALRATGVNFFRLLIPVLTFALLVTFFSLFFNEFVVPSSNQRAHKIQREKIMRLMEPEATENALLKMADGSIVYARKVFEKLNLMERVMIEQYDGNRLARRITAAEATWDGKSWTLRAAVDQTYAATGEMGQKFHPTMPGTSISEAIAEFARKTKRPNEMSYQELSDLINSYERCKFGDTRELQVDLASKTSLPFASFFFALIGASFGLTNYRSGAFIGFGISVIIIFVYYVIMSFATAMGKSGYLPIYVAAWLQNVVFGGVSVLLVTRVNQ